MKKSTTRRLMALLLPLPVIAAGVAYVRFGHPTPTVEIALTFPGICIWYLGLKSASAAAAVGLGYWYLLLAVIGHAVWCGRDRVSRVLLVSLIATSAVIGAVLVVERGLGAD